MPSLWLIYNARPGADLSRLPTVVRTAMAANDSLLRFYYVPLGPFGGDVAANLRPSEFVYWTLCWDSNINVQWSYYSPHYSTRARHVFVRVDHDGPPPIASGMDASWEDAQVHVRKRILIMATGLCRWSRDAVGLSDFRRRRFNACIRYLQRLIDRDIWRQCYWCNFWAENPYIVKRSMGPLCNRCYDWYVAGGGPYPPTALQRSPRWLKLSLKLPEILCSIIASFLFDWHEP